MAYVLLGPNTLGGEKAQSRHEDSWRAKAALKSSPGGDGSLHRVQVPIGRKALDCGHMSAVALDGEKETGPHRLTIEQYCARPAYAVFTADMGSCEAQVIPQHICEEPPRFDVE